MGVSRIVENVEAFQGTRVGTPLYFSPELVRHQPYDNKIDIWAMGYVLYHLACLEPPFALQNLILLGHNIVSKQPRPLLGEYSVRLQKFITSLLSKTSVERPSAAELLKQFTVPLPREINIQQWLPRKDVAPETKIEKPVELAPESINN